MKYNFDEVIDRSNNYAAKFAEANLHYGTNDVIPLWIADMDFKTAEPVIDAILERAKQGIFGYTYRPEEYFEIVADWQGKRNGYQPKTAQMAFAPGVVPAIRMMIQLFTEEGDKIIVQHPVYHPFTDVVVNSNRTLVSNPLCCKDGYYTMDYEDLEQKAKAGAKFLILCNPHNPVGRCWSKEELQKLGDICLRYKIQIIADEIHSDLMLFGNKHTVMASISKEIEQITTTMIAPSKTFNLAGLQSSTVIFPNQEKKERYLSELKKMDIARNNCFSLVATMAAYEKGEPWLLELLPYLEKNMEFIQEYCKENIPMLLPNRPECTYLCWMDARGLKLTEEELLKFTVEKAGVAFSMGYEFGPGGSGFLRLNAACPKSILQKALENMKRAIDANF